MFMPTPPNPSGAPFSTDVIKNEELLTEEMLELKFIDRDNSEFNPTEGGFVSLTFEGVFYDRVYFHRAFPFSAPDRYISVRESCGREKEIGMIKDLSSFEDKTQKLIKNQLELRYFTPKITGIIKVKEEYGYSYWDVSTDRGFCRFTADSNGVIKLSQPRLIINDVDGNRFELPDVSALSAKELRMIDLYI